MHETPTFPLPPIDMKYQVRLDRSRKYVPPESVPVHVDVRPNFREEAQRALLRYMRRDRTPCVEVEPIDPAPAIPVRASSLLERVPRRTLAPLCTGVAAGLLVLQLFYFFLCRPDVHPRLARRIALSPVDVKKSLVVSPRLPNRRPKPVPRLRPANRVARRLVRLRVVIP